MDFSKFKNGKIEDGQGARSINWGEDKSPTNGADLRVFKDGRVYASEDFAKRFDIEYKHKDDTNQFGLDITRTDRWDAFQGEEHYILASRVPRNEAKVDLFGTTRKFNNDGEPEASVTSQGSNRFGRALLTMVEEVYGHTMSKNTNYVDLQVNDNYGMTSPNQIYNLPKQVMRGDKVGEWTTVTRKNTVMYPISIFSTNPTDNTSKEEVNESMDSNNPIIGDHRYEESNTNEIIRQQAEIDIEDDSTMGSTKTTGLFSRN